MTIYKHDGTGNLVPFEENATPTPGSPSEWIENPNLLAEPEQKYEGTWEPGINHPTLPTDATGPYAGITRYFPIPESQIER
jgi:hypothetical protein